MRVPFLALFVTWIVVSARADSTEEIYPYRVTYRYPSVNYSGGENFSSVDGRDGRLYSTSYARSRGGYLYGVSNFGKPTRLFVFPTLSKYPAYNQTGDNPHPAIAVGADGSIYGTTENGGRFGAGTLYRFRKDGYFSILHHFRDYDRIQGAQLLLSADGTLWGCRWDYRIFRFNLPTGLTVISLPVGYHLSGLAQGTDKKIYALTSDGGPEYRTQHGYLSTYGRFFRVGDNNEIEVLADFDSTNHRAWGLQPAPGGGFLTRATPDDSLYTNLLHLSESGGRFLELKSEVSTPSLSPVSIRSDGSVCILESGASFSAQNSYPVMYLDFGDGEYNRIGAVKGFLFGWRSNGTAVLIDEVLNPSRSRVTETLMEMTIPGAAQLNTAPRVFDDFVPLEKVDPSGTKPYVFYPLKNDKDVDGDSLEVTEITQPSSGHVTWDAAKKAMSYFPSPGSLLQENFSYSVSDGNGGEIVGNVFVRRSCAGLYATTFSDPTFGDCKVRLTVKESGAVYGWVHLGGFSWRILGKTDDGGRLVVWSKNNQKTLSAELFLDPQPTGWNLDVSLLSEQKELELTLIQSQ